MSGGQRETGSLWFQCLDITFDYSIVIVQVNKCPSYFSTAAIRHHDKTTCRRVYLGHIAPESESFITAMDKLEGKQAPVLEQLGGHIFSHKQEMESRPRALKTCLSGIFPPGKAILPKPLETGPPSGDQILKCQRLWRTSTSHTSHHDMRFPPQKNKKQARKSWAYVY